MKGIFLKETYSLNVYTKPFLLLMAVIIGINIFTDIGANYASMMMMMYLIIISMNLHQVDSNSPWDRFAVTMPVTRFQIVITRYLFLLVCFVGMFACSFVVSFIVNIIRPHGPWVMELLTSNAMLGLCFLFVNAIGTPLYYKFGAEKSRIPMMFVFMLPYLGAVFLLPYLPSFLQSLSGFYITLLVAGGTAVLFGMYLLSAVVSTRIYAQKEF